MSLTKRQTTIVRAAELARICFALLGITVLIWFLWWMYAVDVRGSRAECEREHGGPCGIVWEPVE